MREIYKSIKRYEGLYEVSNLGNVKSLRRKVVNTAKSFRIVNEKILKPSIQGKVYLAVGLSKGIVKNTYVHKLVAMAFLNHTPNGLTMVIDHINNDKHDNRVTNLQVISQRQNTSKNTKKSRYSNYTGVSKLNGGEGKFVAQIGINKKSVHLGSFENEYDAHLAYQKALKTLKT